MKRQSKTLKALSLVLVQAFVLQELVFAAPELSIGKLDIFQKPKIDLGIPESVATIEDAYQTSIGGGARVPPRLSI